MNQECNAERDLIFGEITRERAAQDEQWGGPTHDDSHDRHEWCEYIRKQNNHAVSSAHNATVFEARMVKVAALALAAIESSRRQRHSVLVKSSDRA
jgi:hypothetical protein